LNKRVKIFLFFIFLASLVHSNEKSIIEALSYLSLTTENLSIPYENLKRDSFNFLLCDDLLKKPQNVELVSENIKYLIEKFKYSALFNYIDKNRFSKQSYRIPTNFKPDLLSRDYRIPYFLIDSTIDDSIYYSQAEIYLNGCKDFYKEYNLVFFLNEVEKIFSLDSTGILKYFEENYTLFKKLGVDVIIDSVGEKSVYRIDKPNVIIVDFGGDDVYFAVNEGSLATGLKSIGGIIDFKGKDQYYGKGFDLGCGIFGVGFMIDKSGDDLYSSSFASIGSGFSGMGILFDDDGNDTYLSSGFSQGFGFTKGIGIIFDLKGNDGYFVENGMIDPREKNYHSHLSQGFGFGIRDIASGGVGILLDLSGNDFYKGEYFVQGSSYWFAFGLLYDSTGSDVYSARRYSQGAGTHLTTGALFDREGNDVYLSWGVSQGCGHDLSSGFLFDYFGDDVYKSDWLSIGAGNDNGNGILIDFEGNDKYFSLEENTLGYGNFSRNTFSIGILFDKDGKDLYNGKELKTLVKSNLGVLIDEK